MIGSLKIGNGKKSFVCRVEFNEKWDADVSPAYLFRVENKKPYS